MFSGQVYTEALLSIPPLWYTHVTEHNICQQGLDIWHKTY